MALERDLPDWQLCYPCSLFHPVDPSKGPKSPWLSQDEPGCVQISGMMFLDSCFKLRYHHEQLTMNRHRFGLPYMSDLERLCHRYACRLGDSHEGTISASIEGCGLVMPVRSSLQLLNGWDKCLIDLRLPEVCRHDGVDIHFLHQTLSETLLCRRSHGDEPPCARCSEWKYCRFCSTCFLIKVQESSNSEINIVVKSRR